MDRTVDLLLLTMHSEELSIREAGLGGLPLVNSEVGTVEQGLSYFPPRAHE